MLIVEDTALACRLSSHVSRAEFAAAMQMGQHLYVFDKLCARITLQSDDDTNLNSRVYFLGCYRGEDIKVLRAEKLRKQLNFERRNYAFMKANFLFSEAGLAADLGPKDQVELLPTVQAWESVSMTSYVTGTQSMWISFDASTSLRISNT